MKNFSVLDWMILIAFAGIFIHDAGTGGSETGILLTCVLLIVKFIVYVAKKIAKK